MQQQKHVKNLQKIKLCPPGGYDLITPPIKLYPPGGYDLIFCPFLKTISNKCKNLAETFTTLRAPLRKLPSKSVCVGDALMH